MTLKSADYDSFSCIAGACPYTCCRDWNFIRIDQASMDEYRKRREIMRGIDGENACFLLRDNRCFFLNESGLCDLILRFGESILCNTCASFPRFVYARGTVTEHSLSAGCPEVNRIWDERTEPMGFVLSEETFPDSWLSDTGIRIRNTMIDVLQYRDCSLHIRLQLLYLFAERASRDPEKAIGIFSGTSFLSVLAEKAKEMRPDPSGLMEKLHVLFRAFAEQCTAFQSYERILAPVIGVDLDVDPQHFADVLRRLDECLSEHAYLLEHICVSFAFRNFAETDAKLLNDQVLSLMIQMSLSAYTVFLHLLHGRALEKRDLHVIFALYARIVDHNRGTMVDIIGDILAEPRMNDGTLRLITHLLDADALADRI